MLREGLGALVTGAGCMYQAPKRIQIAVQVGIRGIPPPQAGGSAECMFPMTMHSNSQAQDMSPYAGIQSVTHMVHSQDLLFPLETG